MHLNNPVREHVLFWQMSLLNNMKKKINWPIIFLFIFSCIFQLGMMLPYALPHCRGATCGYWFPNGSAAHDDSWTMAIASAAFKTFPFQMPLYSGAILQGYHFISAFIIYVISLSGIPIHTIFYGILPLISFGIIAKILVILSQKISRSKTFIFIFIFLFFFGGSFSYLLILYHKLPFFDLFVVTGRQAIDYFQSMPLAVSLIPFLLSIYYLFAIKNISLISKSFYLAGIIFFAWGAKFYGGCAVAVILGTFELLELLKTKKKQHFLLLGIIMITSLLSVLFIYNPFSSQGGAKGTFIFSPFALVHSLIEEKNLFYLPTITLARYTLQTQGWGPRLLAIEIFTWLLYVVYTFGIRIIGFIYFAIKLFKRKVTTADIALMSSVLICLFGGTMFVQRVEWWNTAQFLDYPKIILSIYTALGVSQFLQGKKPAIKITLLLLVVLLSVHNSLQGFMERVTFKSSLVLSQSQIEALTYLKKLPSGNVFTLPYDSHSKSISIKVEDAIDTVYVPVLSQKVMYYSTPYILDLTSTDYSKRKNEVNNYLLTSPYLIGADYFYLIKSNNLYSKTQFDVNHFTKVFENKAVVILRKK